MCFESSYFFHWKAIKRPDNWYRLAGDWSPKWSWDWNRIHLHCANSSNEIKMKLYDIPNNLKVMAFLSLLACRGHTVYFISVCNWDLFVCASSEGLFGCLRCLVNSAAKKSENSLQISVINNRAPRRLALMCRVGMENIIPGIHLNEDMLGIGKDCKSY